MLVTKEEEENSFWIFSFPATPPPHARVSTEGTPCPCRYGDIYKNIYGDF